MKKPRKIAGFIASIFVVTSLFSAFAPVSAEVVDNVNITQVSPLEFACPVVDTSNAGYNIKNTMYKLKNGIPVTIALYGQSITSQDNKWTLALKEYLEGKYPQTEITWINMAVGGWGVDRLAKCVEYDFREVYPDLTILYVYGDSAIYDGVVKTIQEKTNSEIMMINEHKAGSESYEGSHIPTNGSEYGTYWSDAMSYILLPQIAKKYNCEFADIRTYWVEYLEDNNKTKAYTSANNNNDIHLNAKGQSLMFYLLKQYFVERDLNASNFAFKNEKIYKVGSDINWNNGVLELPFDGNRVEVVTTTGKNASASVTIDNKKPSQFIEAYYNTRVTPNQDYYWGNLGSLRKRTFYGFDFLKIPTIQDITMNTSTSSGTNFKVNMTGSVSGNMGSFSSTIRYGDGGDVSAANPANWTSTDGSLQAKVTNFRFEDSLTSNLNFQTSIKLNGTDTLNTSNAGEQVAISGIETGSHTLKLTATDINNLPSIDHIIVRTPIIDPNAVENLISNGDFEAADMAVISSADMNIDVPRAVKVIAKDGNSNNKAYHLNANTGANYCHINYKGLTVGKTYKLSLKYKSTAANSFTVQFHDGTNNKIEKTINTSSTWQTYETTIKLTNSEIIIGFGIWSGDTTAGVYIDDLELYEVKESSVTPTAKPTTTPVPTAKPTATSVPTAKPTATVTAGPSQGGVGGSSGESTDAPAKKKVVALKKVKPAKLTTKVKTISGTTTAKASVKLQLKYKKKGKVAYKTIKKVKANKKGKFILKKLKLNKYKNKVLRLYISKSGYKAKIKTFKAIKK